MNPTLSKLFFDADYEYWNIMSKCLKLYETLREASI